MEERKKNLWLFLTDPVTDFDVSEIVSLPVRRYKHEDTEYTMVACAYLTYPLNVFYSLQVKNSRGKHLDYSLTQICR